MDDFSAGNWQEWTFVAGYVSFLLVIAWLAVRPRS
jgi:hypothetical protein